MLSAAKNLHATRREMLRAAQHDRRNWRTSNNLPVKVEERGCWFFTSISRTRRYAGLPTSTPYPSYG